MENAIRDVKWEDIVKPLQQSERLLEATLRGDEQAVARMVADAHRDNASLIKYSDENSMACVLAIAYYYAHGDYIFHREYQTGTGFADLVLMPRKNTATPAVIVELNGRSSESHQACLNGRVVTDKDEVKYDDTVDTAIDQIRRRQYAAKVKEYTGDMLLVGISYGRKTKEHRCRIERVKIED